MERERGVGAAEASDKMIFERSDGAFCGIATMDTWGNELEIDVFVAHVLLEDGGTFVV